MTCTTRKDKTYIIFSGRIAVLVLLFLFTIRSLQAQGPDTLALPMQEDLTAPDTLNSDTLSLPLQEDLTAPDTLDPDTLILPGQVTLSVPDTLAKVNPDTVDHSPTKAIMYALVLPGLGQGYNRKYFKIPIVYGALGVAGYAIYFNNKNYKEASLDYATDPSDLNERYLRAWRRNLELSYIGMIAVYALQVIDAYVDANLYAWDVSKDLSFRIQPDISPLFLPSGAPVSTYGLSCSLRFNCFRE